MYARELAMGGDCVIEGRSRCERSGAKDRPVPQRADPVAQLRPSSSRADGRRRLCWPSCHARRAIVCRLSCTYSDGSYRYICR
eukprot:3934243-Prymnesium_polylepis.1